jgi:hypothetical protein
MASGSPILAIGPIDGELADIIKQTQTGLISNFEDEITLEKNILNLFVNQSIKTNGEEVIKYSREELTKKLCELLNELN